MAVRQSVVIPTYNGAGRLQVPLRALAAQQGAEPFEVLVVDNASTDGTAAAAQAHAAALAKRGAELRVVREARQGTTFARLRGVLEARGELVGFLDDDVAPEPAYLTEAVHPFADPIVGLVVGRVFPYYAERLPRPGVARRHSWLGCSDQLGEEVIHFGAAATLAPTVGAAMWVRREAFLQAVPWREPERLLSDCIGRRRLSGADFEFGYLMGRAGYDRVYWPALRGHHHLPACRLETRYFCRLIVGVVRGRLTLEAKYQGRHGLWARPLGLARLAAAALAAPVLLLRPDGLNEFLFVLADRWAKVLGPHPVQPAWGPTTSPSAPRDTCPGCAVEPGNPQTVTG